MSSQTQSVIWRQFGRQALEGDSEAIGRLLQAYRSAMTTIAERRIPAVVRSQIGVSDVVQQTCSDVCGSIQGVRARTGEQLWSWVVSLLLKNIVDVQRRLIGCRKRSVLREQRGVAVDTIPINSTGSGPSGIEKLIAEEEIRFLAVALARLPEAYATMLRWHYHEGTSLVDIASRVDRTPDAVRMLMRRAEAALFRELQTPEK